MSDRIRRPAGLTFPIPFPRVEGIPEIAQPAFELGARLQSDLISLCCNRAEAWLNLPSRMISIKSPGGVIAAQGDFLQQMQRDYARFVDSVLHDALIEPEEYEETRVAASPGEPPAREAAQKKREAA